MSSLEISNGANLLEEEMSSLEISDATKLLEGELQAQLNKPLPSRERCIYRVPKLLRQIDDQAYTPILFPIGPNHCQLETNQSKDLKLEYLNSFLSSGAHKLEYFWKVVTENETGIRERYVNPGTSHLDCYMVLTDSAFLIQLFTKGAGPLIDDDLIWGKPYLKHQVYRDILLMENQLPFFILRELLAVQGKSDQDIAKLMSDFLLINYRIFIAPDFISTPNKLGKIQHLLDLMRSYYVGCLDPATNQPCPDGFWIKLIPTATELVQANIKFQAVRSSSLLGIDFNPDKGILTLPELEVGERLECLYKNLIAYEQCHYADEPYLISYFYFMDCLIDTPEDVQVLAKAGVIKNMLGSDEKLSQMFTSLCKKVHVNENAYSYAHQTEEINKHYSTPLNHYKAILKREHFSTPWSSIKFFSAAYLALLTTVGAVAAVLSVPGMPRLFKQT